MNSLKTILTVLIAAQASITALAQQNPGKLTGTIQDGTHRAIQSATLTLLSAKDSSLVGRTASDKTGHFEFLSLPEGKYLLTATAVNHNSVHLPAAEISASAPSVDLKPIVLEQSAKELAAIAVIGKKPFIEQKADRMVINVDASPSNAGSTAMDVLEKSPGVTVDKDDNISLKGKQGVMIMIDNKPTYLSAAQLASYLKSLPASAIDQIELMTNPSAKYDASGNSGIINIKTKKNKMQGFNGSVMLTHTQGVYPKPSGSLNLNYRTGKFNLFLNGGYSRWAGFQQLDITRKYLDTTPAKTVNSIFSQSTHMHFDNPSLNLKFGVDYYLNKHTTLGFVLSGFQNHEHDRSGSTIFLENPNNSVDSIVYSPSRIDALWKNTSINLNLSHQFDSTGTELTADADYIRYASGSSQFFDNISYNPDYTQKGETILTGDLPSTINIYSFKSDFTHPFNKTLKFEGGIKTSYVNTDNIANYDNVINNIPYMDTTKTNHFLYRENVNAVYINLNKQAGKWGIQAGLRYENTNYSGHQLGNGSQSNRDSTFSRSYGDLFPTLYISYQLNPKNQFTINYGRRIDRPAYQDLNPFLFFLDQYTYQAGNPYLQPQFTNNIEFSHTYRQFLTTTLNYSHTDNFFTETFEQQGHATIVRRGNIGSRQNAGIAVSAQVHVTKQWMAILYTNLNYSKFSGFLYGENLDVSATNLLLNINNQFSLGKGWDAELSGFYRTKGVEGQIIIDPMGQASAALSKRMLKDKASVKLGIRDMFYTQKTRGYINFQQTEASFFNSRDSRQVSLSFSYRFGKPLKSNAARRHAGASEEQNRVKVGGGN
ncbi:MAG: TonB-dependent receptor [Bacteroidota bacterium]|nr:TonB-dependent receptor [Bacteroidota bacterium]